MLIRNILSFIFISLTIGLSGLIGATPKDGKETADLLAQAAVTSGQADYVLQPSDLLRVQVFQEDDLQRDARLSQECAVFLPLIGKVNLRGQTLRQAEELIRSLYDKNFLVNPQVTVSVIEYAKKQVNVLGSVNKPGAVDFLPEQNMTLLNAVALAEGFSRLADRKHVTLTRVLGDGKVEKTNINADDIIRGDAENIILFKDDILFVPERLL